MCGRSCLQPGEYTPKKKSGSLRRAKPKAPKATKSDKQLAQERRKGRQSIKKNLFREKNVAKSADPTAPSPNQADEEKIEREKWEEEYDLNLTLMLEQEEEEENRRQDQEEEDMRRRGEESILTSKDDSAYGYESGEDPGYGCCHKSHKSCKEWRYVTGGRCLKHL